MTIELKHQLSGNIWFLWAAPLSLSLSLRLRVWAASSSSKLQAHGWSDLFSKDSKEEQLRICIPSYWISLRCATSELSSSNCLSQLRIFLKYSHSRSSCSSLSSLLTPMRQSFFLFFSPFLVPMNKSASPDEGPCILFNNLSFFNSSLQLKAFWSFQSKFLLTNCCFIVDNYLVS